MSNPINDHQKMTENLASSLKKSDIYHWLVEHGYFPESYVLPPCFKVTKRPAIAKTYFKIVGKKMQPLPPRTEYQKVHFPKTELTDRVFGIINPEIHNDIAFHISQNWKKVLSVLFAKGNRVASYSFPIPIDSRHPGRIGYLRSGRMIYEFVGMIDDDIASVAYKYSHLVKTDIKNFYPSIYTHSLAWALHGKKKARSSINNFQLVGNRLDKLFQNANDGCTNGVPIGPVVSDLAAEIIASAVDSIFSTYIKKEALVCEIIRFKDDYRILATNENDGQRLIKLLQASLKEFNLELNDEKTKVTRLPDGLFREWVSMYHIANPRKKRFYSWKEFREIYLSVLRIDRTHPGTGVIDRFLADIITKHGDLRIRVHAYNIQKVMSMLLMLGELRIKAFPKVMAVIEALLRHSHGSVHTNTIVEHLDAYLLRLAADEARNKYLISWISYFLASNGLKDKLTHKPKLKDAITRSTFNSKRLLFKNCPDFDLFIGCKKIGAQVTMLQHLDVFNPPRF